jgi:hypothetical protein
MRDRLYEALSYSPVPSSSHTVCCLSPVLSLVVVWEPEICASGNDSG